LRFTWTKSPLYSDHVEVQEHGDEDHEADDMPVDGTLVRADLTSSEQQPAKRQRVAAIDIADKVRTLNMETPLLTDASPQPPMDFFGRVITVAASNKLKSRQGAVPKTEKKLGVSFRFNEGNSAAVRRPVKVSTFM
jgi:chromosome transmission fidelity protein 18